jgi:hypothetical protein
MHAVIFQYVNRVHVCKHHFGMLWLSALGVGHGQADLGGQDLGLIFG